LIVRLSDAYRQMLAALLCALGPQAAYAIMAALARVMYRLAEPLRQHSEAQCRAALADSPTAVAITDLPAQAFVHRAWNLADLMLARRFIRAGSYQRYGGSVPEPYLGLLLRAQRERKPVILLTAYYGPYDLLPLFLGYNGIRAGAVYRAHGNPRYDAFRNAVRSASGCELIPVERALDRLSGILESGGAVAILADQEDPRRGVPVRFLGLPTHASRAVGLLAEHYGAIVVVAGVRRRNEAFQFEFIVSDIFDPSAWRDEADPVTYITRRYVTAMERIVFGDPAQYLWAHARWSMKSTDPAGCASARN
jgi:lauroyl/myristoyl acyltransferase